MILKKDFADITSGTVNSGKLIVELQASVASVTMVTLYNFSGYTHYDNTKDSEVRIHHSSALTQQEINDIDAIYIAHEDYTLDEYKALKNATIDDKTGELIGSGFVHASETFSLSLNAQINWHALKAMKTEFAYPLEVSTKDNKKHSLTDTAAVDSLWSEGKDILKGHLDSGRDLKDQINQAVDKAAVDAVNDTR